MKEEKEKDGGGCNNVNAATAHYQISNPQTTLTTLRKLRASITWGLEVTTTGCRGESTRLSIGSETAHFTL